MVSPTICLMPTQHDLSKRVPAIADGPPASGNGCELLAVAALCFQHSP
jgi:hypothetical protein